MTKIEFTLKQQILALANQHFLIRRSNLDCSSDPGKVLTELVRTGKLRPHGNGIYTLPALQIEPLVDGIPENAIVCMESALWLHMGVRELRLPICIALMPGKSANDEVFATFESADENVHNYDASEIQFKKSVLRCYSAERALVETIAFYTSAGQQAGTSLQNATVTMIEMWKAGRLSSDKLRAVAAILFADSSFEALITVLEKLPKAKKLANS